MDTHRMNDGQLLANYSERQCEKSFTEFARRHLDLVYSSALRQLGEESGAVEDVVQAVFIEVARQARSLRGHPALAAWLHKTTRHMVLNVRRSRERQARRETEVQRGSQIPKKARWKSSP